SRRRHTRSYGDWSSDVCSSDLRPDFSETQDMDDEERQRTMDFILRQQAQFTVGMQKLEEQQAQFAAGMQKIEEQQGRFAAGMQRSEERRVGKEWRSRRATED